MLNFLVGFSVISLYMAIFGHLFLLPLLRVLIVVLNHTPKQKAFNIILIPLSIGYYMNVEKKNIVHNIYIIIQVLLFIFALLGTFFLFYTRFA